MIKYLYAHMQTRILIQTTSHNLILIGSRKKK